jgi:hypothetical protein
MMTQDQAELYRAWIYRLRATEPEWSETARMVEARERAMRGIPVPPIVSADRPAPVPPKPWRLPTWARIALVVGGKALIRGLVGTRYRIAATAFFGAYMTACTVGALPDGLCLHEAEIGALLVDVGVVEPTPAGAPTPTALPEE